MIERRLSPNYDSINIPVEFIVLHYTAGSASRALETLMDPSKKVSCHLMIDGKGKVYELVNCLDGKAKRAWHAGKSHFEEQGKQWKDFNDFSIGIELVNYNGNVFNYSEEQYVSLESTIQTLAGIYPALMSPWRLVGHEQIAGWRGKADPGLCFDWSRIFANCYPNQFAPQRQAICPTELQKALALFVECRPSEGHETTKLWRAVSRVAEAAIALTKNQRGR